MPNSYDKFVALFDFPLYKSSVLAQQFPFFVLLYVSVPLIAAAELRWHLNCLLSSICYLFGFCIAALYPCMHIQVTSALAVSRQHGGSAPRQPGQSSSQGIRPSGQTGIQRQSGTPPLASAGSYGGEGGRLGTLGTAPGAVLDAPPLLRPSGGQRYQ